VLEISYPTLMSHEMLRQQVIDRINTLLMRLFDPDGTYSRFGKFDGEGRAIALSKKLDAIASAQGTKHVKRLHGRMHRATPLVRAVLGLSGTGNIADTKTRVMMLQSDLGGTAASGGVVAPPQDADRQSALLKAAMNRLPFKGRYGAAGNLEAQPASARQPQNSRHKEKGEKVQSPPRSAREGGGSERTPAAAGASGPLGVQRLSPIQA